MIRWISSGDLRYNTVNIVNNTVLYSSIVKKADLE